VGNTGNSAPSNDNTQQWSWRVPVTNALNDVGDLLRNALSEGPSAHRYSRSTCRAAASPGPGPELIETFIMVAADGASMFVVSAIVMARMASKIPTHSMLRALV
jgi:hypothetical protein